MIAYIFGCPKCQQVFQIRQVELGQVMRCPHCQQLTRIPDEFTLDQGEGQKRKLLALNPSVATKPAQKKESLPQIDSTPPRPATNQEDAVQRNELALPEATEMLPPTFCVSEELTEAKATSQAESMMADLQEGEIAAEITDWLPPKFDVYDPSRLRNRARSSNQVILPSSDGGIQTVDQRIVTIEYKGEKYRLVALSPEAKKRRQWIINLISIALALLALFVTFKILTW